MMHGQKNIKLSIFVDCLLSDIYGRTPLIRIGLIFRVNFLRIL